MTLACRGPKVDRAARACARRKPEEESEAPRTGYAPSTRVFCVSDPWGEQGVEEGARCGHGAPSSVLRVLRYGCAAAPVAGAAPPLVAGTAGVGADCVTGTDGVATALLLVVTGAGGVAGIGVDVPVGSFARE